MSEYFNIYENIDTIDIPELKRTAGLNKPDEIVWPKGKKYKVQVAGKEFQIATSVVKLDERVKGDYDAYTALSTMLSRDEVVDKIWKEDPNGHTDAVDYAMPEFLPGLPKLTKAEIEQRRAFTAVIFSLLSDQKTMELIAESAPKKKNGFLFKGRIFKIGLTGLADSYENQLMEIVAKNKDDTNILISVTKRNTSPDELAAWNNDFISTYHEGLPISEALKTVFNSISIDEKPQKPKKIKPDLYDGLGDGIQELDLSDLEKDSDYTKGLRSKDKQEAQKAIDELSKYKVDPNTINWDGKGVSIDREYDYVFREKLFEVGAMPLRTYNSRMNYMIESFSYKDFVRMYNSLTEVKYFVEHINRLIDIAKDIDGVIEATDFLKWCVNGHEIKYDLSKDEHLQEFENTKMTFKKIDTKMFIKQAITNISPLNRTGTKDIDNGDVLYCVVGTGDKAERIRSFFRDINKIVMDHYIEGARWPKLILGDVNGEEEKRAYKVALFNKKCGEKVQIMSADQVLEIINTYGDAIKTFANEKCNNNDILEQSAKYIIEAGQSGAIIDPKQAKEDASKKNEDNITIVKNAIKKIDNIDCNGKVFVFTGNDYKKADGTYYGSNESGNPNVKKVLERGGIIRDKVTGKTDYFIINTHDGYAWEGARVRDAAIQLEKRDTLTVITRDNLLDVFDKELWERKNK